MGGLKASVFIGLDERGEGVGGAAPERPLVDYGGAIGAKVDAGRKGGKGGRDANRVRVVSFVRFLLFPSDEVDGSRSEDGMGKRVEHLIGRADKSFKF